MSIYMKGPNANFTFATASTISLTAGKSGPLSGLLIYDDPTGAAAPEQSGKHAKADKSPREHSILSDDARLLLGTIYLPKGRLIIDATKPIADPLGLHGAGGAAARPLRRAEPGFQYRLPRLRCSDSGRRRSLWRKGLVDELINSLMGRPARRYAVAGSALGRSALAAAIRQARALDDIAQGRTSSAPTRGCGHRLARDR